MHDRIRRTRLRTSRDRVARSVLGSAALCLFLALLPAARAQPAPDPPDASTAHSAEPVRAAPNGGEMVILRPESQYVTRAWIDGDGRARAACGHTDAPPKPEEER